MENIDLVKRVDEAAIKLLELRRDLVAEMVKEVAETPVTIEKDGAALEYDDHFRPIKKPSAPGQGQDWTKYLIIGVMVIALVLLAVIAYFEVVA
jgi:hypothetical protein